MRKDDVLARVSASVVLYACLYLAFFTDISKAIHIKVIYRDVYIPLVGWACIAAYAFLWSKISGEKFKNVIAKAALLGFIAHLCILLFKLNMQLASGSPLAKVYLCYIEFVTIASMAVLLSASVYIIRRFTLKRDRAALFFLPAIFLFLNLSYLYFKINIIIPLVAVFIGSLFSGILFLQKASRRSIAQNLERLMSNERLIVAILFLLGFAVRFTFSLQILRATGGGSVFVDASDDARSYDPMAWTIAQNPLRALTGGEVFPAIWDPGYILFLSLVYKVFGHNFYAATIIQSAVNALVPVVVYYIAARIFSRRIGIISAVCVCMDQALIMYSVVIGTEALYILLLALTILFFTQYMKKTERRIYIWGTGIFMGLAIITRSMLMLLPVFMFITLLFIKGRALRYKFLDIVCIVLIALLAILPITSVNYVNTKQFHLIAKSNERLNACWTSEWPGGADVSPSNNKLIAMGVEPFEKPLDSFLSILKHPVDFCRIGMEIWSKRFRNFFLWPNFGYSDPLVLVNPSRFANEFGSTAEFYIFLIFMIGLYFAAKSVPTNRHILILFMVILYFLCVHVLLLRVNSVRYRVAVIPCMFIIFSLGVDRISSLISRGLRGRL